MNESTKKSGIISVIGRTNVGKSTLINKILGQKIFITSRKPQTTRNRLIGIKTKDNSQAIFVDTPGIHQGENRALNEYMNKVAFNAMLGVDILLFVIEKLTWNSQDQEILDKLPQDVPNIILLINKIDQLTEKNSLLPFIKEVSSRYTFKEIIPISALKNKNLITLENLIFSNLPERDHDYPEDQLADVPEKFLVSELIREKCITRLGDEIPYRLMVGIDSFEEKKGIIDISSTLYIEKQSQKGILIGRKGEKLKNIGTAARRDIEKLLGKKVMLRLWVKVKKDWTNNKISLNAFGYSDE
jgi:GTPase